MKLGAWSLVVLAACGKSSPPKAGEGAAGASAHGSAAPAAGSGARWLECTEASRAPMEAALLRRYHLDRLDERIDGLTCVTIQLGARPAFFVELVGAHDDKRRRLHGVVATDGTTELVPLRDVTLDWARLRGGVVWFETVDLDGDGAEEIVVHRGDERQPVADWLDLIVIHGTSLVELEGPRISYDDPDIDEVCRGVLTEPKVGRARHLVVTTRTSTGVSDHCLAVGRHEFALEGDRLVELTAPAPAPGSEQ